MPESEHPRNTDSPASPTANKQWNLFLASEDFAAFILYSLRIDTGDATSGLPVARWLLSQRRDADVTPTILASLFRDCAKAAIDEWQQEQRNGRAKGQTLTDAEETAAIIEALTEATESLEQCDGSDTDSVAI